MNNFSEVELLEIEIVLTRGLLLNLKSDSNHTPSSYYFICFIVEKMGIKDSENKVKLLGEWAYPKYLEHEFLVGEAFHCIGCNTDFQSSQAKIKLVRAYRKHLYGDIK